MSDAIGRGLVLVMSIWDDGDSHMQWLDGTTPVGSTKPGAARGTCPPNSGIPSEVES
jgi:cellulose 1,4-beta-cellobiosidase